MFLFISIFLILLININFILILAPLVGIMWYKIICLLYILFVCYLEFLILLRIIRGVKYGSSY